MENNETEHDVSKTSDMSARQATSETVTKPSKFLVEVRMTYYSLKQRSLKNTILSKIGLSSHPKNKKNKMELEAILLVKCKCHEGKSSEIFSIVFRTPLTDCQEDMIKDLARQVPSSHIYQGLIASRVVTTPRDGEKRMCFVSPIRTKPWEAFENAFRSVGHGTKNGAYRKMMRHNAKKSARKEMKKNEWEEPTKRVPIR